MDNTLKKVITEQQFKKVDLKVASKTSYLFIAAEIDTSIFPLFYATSKRKKSIIKQSKEWCKQLQLEKGIVSAAVFKATLIPPGRGKLLKERSGVHIARYDFAILIEADKEKVQSILQEKKYEEITSEIQGVAKHVYITTATNIKRIDNVDHSKQGVFLFNYFYADDLNQNLQVWEYTAGWFQQETGLDNSTVLLPVNAKESEYKIINHCRWNGLHEVLPSLLFKRSFRTYVLANFYINNVAAMPVFYKLA